ncbi:MAG TPA: sigma-70 family RNA polymerase sigma factor [Candidatus Methylomirabilis sp.]|nr:sigma-70 family RNA polymerase sigma factor [Candidatus Methylomirabilis sp.]
MDEGHPDVGGQTSDQDLVRQTLAGEQRAFEVLVHRYQRLVFRVIHGMAPGAEVEDIAQEVFLRAYRSLGQVRHDSRLGPWLIRIAVNLCYDHLRRLRRRQERSFSELTEREGMVLDRLMNDETALAQIDRLALRELAEKVVGQLAPQDRAVLLLKEREGLATREIARSLGFSETAVRLRLFRARRALRKVFGKTVDWPGRKT